MIHLSAFIFACVIVFIDVYHFYLIVYGTWDPYASGLFDLCFGDLGLLRQIGYGFGEAAVEPVGDDTGGGGRGADKTARIHAG